METTLLSNGAADPVNVITIITYLLFLYLIIAIFVERTVEIFVSIVKYVDYKLGWYKIWNRKAEKIRSKMDRLYGFQGNNTEDKKRLFSWILWQVVTDKPYTGGKAIIAAKSVRAVYYRMGSRIFAFIISLLFSLWIYSALQVDLLTILSHVAGPDVNIIGGAGPVLKIIVTAVILSAGSEPLHQMISKVEGIGKSKKGENHDETLALATK